MFKKLGAALATVTGASTIFAAAASNSPVTGFASLGGVGLLAYALLTLHREALTAFREELHAERQECARLHSKLRDDLSIFATRNEATLVALTRQLAAAFPAKST